MIVVDHISEDPQFGKYKQRNSSQIDAKPTDLIHQQSMKSSIRSFPSYIYNRWVLLEVKLRKFN